MHLDADTAVVEWAGVKYGIPAQDQMRLIGQIEEILGGNACEAILSGKSTESQLCSCLAAIIRAGGGDISALELYRGLQDAYAKGEAESVARMSAITLAIISLLSPPLHSKILEMQEESAAPGKEPDAA